MGKEYRRYRDGSVHHVYSKAVDGNIIFYSVKDCIFYLTLYYHLARRYGIKTLAFCIMPNHVHSNEKAPSRDDFILFHCRLNSEFSQGYNAQHKRKGALFAKSFGFAPKVVAKRVRDSIAYVVNNPFVGNLSKNIEEYRWNLMAYRNTDHPFSEKIRMNKASYRLRRSLSILKYYHNKGIPLDYTCQKILFKGLSKKETAQLRDRIITMHNFLDYKAMAQFYQGDIEKAVTVISANSGSEYDIPEDFEDYSVYQLMIRMTQELGFDMETCNFEILSSEELTRLIEKFSFAGFSVKQIRKYLHLSLDWGSGRGV